MTRLGLRPAAVDGSGRVGGRWRPPGSKSIAQRALVAAGLCGGTTRLAGLPDGADVQAARELVAAAGARVERPTPASASVTGVPPGPHRGWQAAEAVELGESGTLARFALAAFGLCGRAGRPVTLRAGGSLARRGSAPLVRTLRAAGVEFAREPWPAVLSPIGPPSRLELADPVSSQEVSALLIALAAWPDELELAVTGAIPSRPYVDLTAAVLARFGVELHEDSSLWRVRGPLREPVDPIVIEADASSAAVALAAAVLTGGELEVGGLGASSAQGDRRIVEHLAAFGCTTTAEADSLRAAGRPRSGAELDLSGEPDLAPVLAIVAAAAALEGGESLLGGLGTLPGKESSRIEVLAGGLAAAGWSVESGADSLSIGPPARPLEGGELRLDPRGDHRMAFAFALLGLLREGVWVEDASCVAKSWPGFWRDLEQLGARVERSD